MRLPAGPFVLVGRANLTAAAARTRPLSPTASLVAGRGSAPLRTVRPSLCGVEREFSLVAHPHNMEIKGSNHADVGCEGQRRSSRIKIIHRSFEVNAKGK